MSNTMQNSCNCGCCAACTGLTPLNVENEPGLSALQFRIGSHGSFKDSMLKAISAEPLLSGLTARFDDDLAIATIDAWATVLDVLTFYQERIINEGYLRTSTERLSVVELARHISYRPAPGVAAETCLTFLMNDAPGSPLKAFIPAGTKVQSIPEQDQLPQIFETVEDLPAQVEWNSIPILKGRKIIPGAGATQIYLDGINTGLQAGDSILMVGSERENDINNDQWNFRKVHEVIPDNNVGRTLIIWAEPLVAPPQKKFKIYALRQRLSLFGANAPDFRTLSGNVKSQFIPAGLLTQIYNDIGFGTLSLTRIDSNIDNNWGSGSPAAGINTDNFSIRWSGLILPPVTGEFTFYTQSDDGVELRIDNNVILTNLNTHPSTEDMGTVWLQAGQLYNFHVDYFEAGGDALIQVSWSGPGLSKQIIPAGSFFQPGIYNNWPDFTVSAIAGAADTICLDAVYSKIIKDGWVLLKDGINEELYQVTDAVETAKNNFAISSKSTTLTLSGLNLNADFDNRVRETSVFAQSEELIIADSPVSDSIKNDKEITLGAAYPDLQKGKTIIVSGKRYRILVPEEAEGFLLFVVPDNIVGTRYLKKDDSLILLSKPEIIGAGVSRYHLMDSGGLQGTLINYYGFLLDPQPAYTEDEIVSELHSIDSLKPGSDPTVIILKEPLNNYFYPQSVTIAANISRSTHGDTKTEVLGSGDSSAVFQKFDLKQTPLTYISAATASGTETTLQIRVNDILWTEVNSFYNILPRDKVYTTSMNDAGTVTVEFGDGITGARLPSGVQNVKATYRVGIGIPGDLKAGQLSMIMTPVLGVNKCINQLPATGAADPELRDTAKQNAPLTVLTLDRIVSTTDIANFARAFAGIGKTQAEMVWSGEQQVVLLTIAAKDQHIIDQQSDLYLNLVSAIQTSGHSYNKIFIQNYNPVDFSLDAGIKIDDVYLFEDVSARVINALAYAFSFDMRDFSQDLTPAEVITVIQNVEGVIYTDLQALNGTDPFTVENFRLKSAFAHFQGNTIVPADLLLINKTKINITRILP